MTLRKGTVGASHFVKSLHKTRHIPCHTAVLQGNNWHYCYVWAEMLRLREVSWLVLSHTANKICH